MFFYPVTLFHGFKYVFLLFLASVRIFHPLKWLQSYFIYSTISVCWFIHNLIFSEVMWCLYSSYLLYIHWFFIIRNNFFSFVLFNQNKIHANSQHSIKSFWNRNKYWFSINEKSEIRSNKYPVIWFSSFYIYHGGKYVRKIL